MARRRVPASEARNNLRAHLPNQDQGRPGAALRAKKRQVDEGTGSMGRIRARRAGHNDGWRVRGKPLGNESGEDLVSLAGPHVDSHGIRQCGGASPIMRLLTFAEPRRKQRHASRDTTPGERHPKVGSGTKGRSNTRYHLNLDTGIAQGVNFLGSSSEEHWIPAFKADYHVVLPGSVHQPLVDESLGR